MEDLPDEQNTERPKLTDFQLKLDAWHRLLRWPDGTICVAGDDWRAEHTCCISLHATHPQ